MCKVLRSLEFNAMALLFNALNLLRCVFERRWKNPRDGALGCQLLVRLLSVLIIRAISGAVPFQLAV